MHETLPRSVHGLGLPPPTEFIRIPERVRSAEEVLEAARAARDDPRWRARQWIARVTELGGDALDFVEHHGLGFLALFGRHVRIALWRVRRRLRNLAADVSPPTHTPTHSPSDFDRAETKMTMNPYGTETGSA